LIFLSFNGSYLVEAQDKRPSEIVAADGTKLHYVVEGSGIPCVVVNGSHYRRVFQKRPCRFSMIVAFFVLRYKSFDD
jgi:hypothetical protein